MYLTINLTKTEINIWEGIYDTIRLFLKVIAFFLFLTILATPLRAQFPQIGEDIDGEAAGDESGASVSLNADGTVVAIGALGNSNFTGHVRVYRNESGTWTQVGQDIDGEKEYDESGIVSISADGNTVAIGAPLNSFPSGRVRVYSLNESTNQTMWTQIGQDIDGEAALDRSGWSVSLSADGTTVAIGAPLNRGRKRKGYVRIYRNISDTWTQIGPDIDGEAAGDASGTSVSLSADGTTVAIGADLNDGDEGNATSAGHVRVYDIGATINIAAVSSSVNEGIPTSFTLTRTGVTLGVLPVNVKVTQDGEYIKGTAPTTINFEDGATTITLEIPTTDDNTAEADGSVKVTIIDGASYKVGDGSVATVTVTDDDMPVVTIAEAASVTEGTNTNVTFTLSRERVITGTLDVNVRIEQEATTSKAQQPPL